MLKPLYKILFILTISASFTGCASLIASSTGSKPIGAAEGERTLSQRIEDSSIANTAEINLHKLNPDIKNANVNIISFYGSVLLTGQVANAEQKAQAEKIVRDIAEVKSIHNELTIGASSFYMDRMSDGIISTKIRSRFMLEKGFDSSRTKVFTVGGCVYLMGKLHQDEAYLAVDIIKKVSGVQKIVKLIDYLPGNVLPAPASNP